MFGAQNYRFLISRRFLQTVDRKKVSKPDPQRRRRERRLRVGYFSIFLLSFSLGNPFVSIAYTVIFSFNGRQAFSCFSPEHVRYLMTVKVNGRNSVYGKTLKMEKCNSLGCRQYLVGNSASTEDAFKNLKGNIRSGIVINIVNSFMVS